MVKACGVVMAMLPGYQLGTGPADRCVVNVGTVRCRPSRRAASLAAGRLVAGCRLSGGAESP